MAMVPGKAPTPPTVTLKHLAAALAETHEMSKKQAEAVLGDFVGNIVKHLKKGERIRIGGLGILQVRKRAARMGRNPGDRRGDSDQGEQEGRLPRLQGIERSDLTVRPDPPGRIPAGGELIRLLACRFAFVSAKIGSPTDAAGYSHQSAFAKATADNLCRSAAKVGGR